MYLSVLLSCACMWTYTVCIEKHEASAASISQVLLKTPKFVDILTVSMMPLLYLQW